jgi:hypothetical protein
MMIERDDHQWTPVTGHSLTYPADWAEQLLSYFVMEWLWQGGISYVERNWMQQTS